MTGDPLHILVFGAHPDDPDQKAGGVAALYARQGHKVRLISLTNGDAGHHQMAGEILAWLRDFQEPRLRRAADLYRDKLIELYGEAKGRQIQYAEAFEACEYGAPLTAESLKRLFPFFA